MLARAVAVDGCEAVTMTFGSTPGLGPAPTLANPVYAQRSAVPRNPRAKTIALTLQLPTLEQEQVVIVEVSGSGQEAEASQSSGPERWPMSALPRELTEEWQGVLFVWSRREGERTRVPLQRRSAPPRSAKIAHPPHKSRTSKLSDTSFPTPAPKLLLTEPQRDCCCAGSIYFRTVGSDCS